MYEEVIITPYSIHSYRKVRVGRWTGGVTRTSNLGKMGVVIIIIEHGFSFMQHIGWDK
jgi:hypothetical protein